MKASEKILAAFIIILLVLVVVLAWKVSNIDSQIEAENRTRNEMHEDNIKAMNHHIDSLAFRMLHLLNEIEELEHEEPKIREQTINTIDSVSRLPFIEQASYFTTEVTRVDSIRSRYIGDGNG